MTSIFDTLEYTKGAEKAGFTREQAEFQAIQLAKIIKHDLATKRDIHSLELSIKELEISLKKDMLKMKNDLIIKLGGLMVVCSGVILGVLGFLVKI